MRELSEILSAIKLRRDVKFGCCIICLSNIAVRRNIMDIVIYIKIIFSRSDYNEIFNSLCTEL